MSEQQQALSIEDQELAYTRALRRKFIGDLTSEGTVFPTDPESIEAFTKLLADVDKQALSLKKIKVQEQANKQNGESAALIAQMLTKLTGAKMQAQFSTDAQPPELPEGSSPVITDGLTDSNPGSETFADFSQRMFAEETVNTENTEE